ncbi:glycosyltransferase family 2 protein [Salegentibacter sp. F14]
MNPQVSIVIACYNDPDVVKAVKSAKSQTYLEKEIILVNDGSDKLVADIMENLRKDVDLLISQENLGQSIARNNGIDQATGKYILNLDSDDFFEPEFCKKAVKLMEDDPEIKIVTCKALRFTKKTKIDIYTPRGGDYKNFLIHNSALGSSMFRKEDWKVCEGYETDLPVLGFEDWELYLNILKDGGRAVVIDEVLFNYQVRHNSTTARIKHLKQEKFKQIVFKHRDLYVKHFDLLVNDLFERIKKEEREKIRISNTLDARLGGKLLSPLRFLIKILQ